MITFATKAQFLGEVGYWPFWGLLYMSVLTKKHLNSFHSNELNSIAHEWSFIQQA